MPNHSISGPIPGENYTSDTKNYPWHRPPEITKLDDAIDASAKQLMSEEGAIGIVTLLKRGVDIASLTDMFVTSGIGAGKWTPDFALLLAGPVSHIIYLMAKGYGIPTKLGIDLPKPKYTASYFDQIQLDKDAVDQVMKTLDDPEVKSHIQQHVGGFLGMIRSTDQSPPPIPGARVQEPQVPQASPQAAPQQPQPQPQAQPPQVPTQPDKGFR